MQDAIGPSGTEPEVKRFSKSRISGISRMSPKMGSSGDILRRIGKGAGSSLMGRVAGATTAVLTEASSLLLDEISGCPVGLTNANAQSNLPRTSNMRKADLGRIPDGERPHRRERRGRAGEFRQRLDVLLATDGSARAVARQLYERFEGDLSRLPALLQLLEDRWEFPTRVFSLLWVHIRRASGRSEDHDKNVSEDEWAVAFDNWLQALRTRCGYTKVSRQCLVHTRHGDDWNKVYLKGAKLGEGSYGEVFLALHASLGVARVVKSVPKSQLSVAGEQVEDEVNMLKSLDHPHIVRVFEAFESEESLHIVMDYAEGGDLASVIRETLDSNQMLPHLWVQEAALQVASAVDYMHSRGVIHCDLKPGNTMLLTPFVLSDALQGKSQPHVLLVDFGLAEIFDEQAALGGPATVKGSPAYLSPEGFDGKLTQKSDTWAMGVMLYEMLVGSRPFRGTNNIFVLYCQVANTEPNFDSIPELPCSLVKALMEKKTEQRLSARQCFVHEWLQEVNELDFCEKSKQSNASGVPKSFTRPSSYFHRAVTFSMAAALGMKDLTADYHLFQALDADKSGQIDQEELRSGLEKLGLRQDPNGLMASMDLDQDGQISYTEFLGATLNLDEERGDRLMRYAFSMFDLDGDGQINMEELRHLLSGDGAVLVSDLLPDGQTVDEVMEEVSGGDGVISFAHFRSYLMHIKHSQPSESWMAKGSTGQKRPPEGDGTRSRGVAEDKDASDLMNRLDASEGQEEEEETQVERAISRGRSFPGPETSAADLMGFHQWLDDLLEDQRRDGRLNIFLRFRDSRVEAAYVSHYVRSTLRQAQVLALPVAGYSIFALLTEKFRWEPSLCNWETDIQVVNNLAWLTIFFGSLGMFGAIAVWLWRRKKKAAELQALEVKQESANKGFAEEAIKAEADFDREAIIAEHVLSIWASVTPWLCCFFANRRRLAALWGVNASEVFPSVSSDYDLIFIMLGTLMFFSMRTNLTFLHALPVALSCVLAFLLSSIMVARSVEDPDENYAWGWTLVLLVVSSGMCLSGHRNLEYQRRLSFLSLYASYAVLKDMEVSDPLVIEESCSPRSSVRSINSNMKAQSKGPETRLARLKRGTKLLSRLCASAHGGSTAFRNALLALLDILQSARDDLAQADRLLAVDMAELLEQKGIEGDAKLKLLNLFEELPPVPPLPLQVDHMLEDGNHSPESEKEKSDKPEAWGWEVLNFQNGGSSGSTKMDPSEPLSVAAATLLVPTVSECFPLDGSDSLGRALLERLLEVHRTCAPGSAHRAALTLRATNWIPRQTGLWLQLEPGERAALLVAAAGLHAVPVGPVKALGFKQELNAILAGEDPLLTHIASTSSTMLALSSSGLAGVSTSSALGEDEKSCQLWRLTQRLQYRARPSRALQDLKTVRMLLEADEEPLPFNVQNLQNVSAQELEEAKRAARERRLLLAGLVLAAGDLAYLALPQKQHLLWASLVREEKEVGQCAAEWLRGLAETLAIPLYDTLHTVGELACRPSNRQPLSVPLSYLRDNARYWTKHTLIASGKPSRRSTGEVSPMASERGKVQVVQEELPGQVLNQETSIEFLKSEHWQQASLLSLATINTAEKSEERWS